MDLSPHDQQWSTCLKEGLSEMLDGRHVVGRGSSDIHRTAAIIRDRGNARGAIAIGGFSSDGRDLSRWEHRVDRDPNLHQTADGG